MYFLAEFFQSEKISVIQQIAITEIKLMVISVKKDAKMQEIRIKTAIHLRINLLSESGSRRLNKQLMMLPPSRNVNGNKLNMASERFKIAKFSQSGRKIFKKIKKNMFAQGPASRIIIS